MSVFLGFLPDDAANATLAALQAEAASHLAADVPGHAWRTDRQWHMTLVYLGDALPVGMQARIHDAIAPLAAQTPPLSLRFDGLQYWPGANVLIARFAQDDALAALHARSTAALTALGLAPEKRKPQPHVTLAYLPKGARVPAHAPNVALEAATFRIDTLYLLSTRPGHYASLHTWALGTDAA